MGEWSDYFEDFPEEAPGYRDPSTVDHGAEGLAHATAEKAFTNQLKLNAEIKRIIKKHSRKA